MGIPVFFIIFVIFILWFNYSWKKRQRIDKEKSDLFWKQERESLFTRKKEVPKDLFIEPNVSSLPRLSLDDMKDISDDAMYQTQELCFSCANIPMLDLSHMLNSDIRLTYGTSNLPLIEKYEDNYNNYTKAIFQLGKKYYGLNMFNEALSVLKEGINVQTKISDNYILLAKIYKQNNNIDAIQSLIYKAERLNTLTKRNVIKALNKLT